jgi:hypothetical protein
VVEHVNGPSLLDRAVRHAQSLWPGRGVVVPWLFVAWALICLVLGAGRWEHVAFLVGVPLLAYATPRTKRLFVGLLPMAILGVVYDSMRWVKDLGVTAAKVHVCDLRAIDMRIASVTVNGEPGSVHDWIQLHPSTPLALVSAIPYGTFLYVALAFAVFLYVKDYPRMLRFGWCFLLLNVVGFVTYHLYPAAPPWYFHTHGCHVDLAARASEGEALAHVDTMLGFPYFHAFYGRSADVFGAVPSLHVGYPSLILLFGWPVFRWPGRLFALAFLTTMCVGAVYLDHHWIFDVLVGLFYSVVTFAAVAAFERLRARMRGRIREEEDAATAVDGMV